MEETGPTLQEQVEEQEEAAPKGYGMFGGVFCPTLLTILGVIMFLREGWVIGNAGLLGGWIIICIAFAIVASTALSMSSIVTNIRIGKGGAYSIISQSLGLEVGGSVGVPLYLAQALAVVMYIFGFREGWIWIMDGMELHWLLSDPLVVDMVTFGTLFVIAFVSAGLAFKIQYVILAIIVASLVSIGLSVWDGVMTEPITWWGEFPGAPEDDFPGVSFWVVFAVFFPAATGIMAGANMSADLENPRRAIPLGTLGAIAVSFVIYMALAYWLARVATPEELVSNYTVMIDKAFWEPAVLAGLLGATFSSGLASLVGAPRILEALGSHKILPKGDWFARRSASGEPRNAIWITGGIVFVALFMRDLNAIAPLITMFFLITYMMINLVVLIEQSLDMVSFRPTMRIPIWVPFIGTAGCLLVMFIINPTFGLAALAVVIGVYVYLTQRALRAPYGDMRSGLFVSLAEWAAQKVSNLPSTNERAWKANLLVPVENTRELRGTFNLIRNIAYPKGSVKLIGLTSREGRSEFRRRLPNLSRAFQGEGVFTRWSVIDAEEFEPGVRASMQTYSGTFFRPNLLFLRLHPERKRDDVIPDLIEEALDQAMGSLLFLNEPEAGLGRRKSINVWVSDRSPDWDLSMDLGNLDLPLLVAYKLMVNWNASVTLHTALQDEAYYSEAEDFLERLLNLSRLARFDYTIHTKNFTRALTQAPQADLSVFGITDPVELDSLRSLQDHTESACLYVSDSGQENILA